MDKPLLFKIPYGVFLITTESKEVLAGCIVHTVMQITDFPTSFVVSIYKKSHTANLMKESKKCIIGLISENLDINIIQHFLSHTGDVQDKFDTKYSDIFTYKMFNGMPCLDKNIVYNLTCDVSQVIDVDTHYVFVLRLTDTMEISKNDTLMSYEMYRKKKSFAESTKEKKQDDSKSAEHARTNFICTVCRYIYEGNLPFEELPDNYVCPQCGRSKDFFIEKYIFDYNDLVDL